MEETTQTRRSLVTATQQRTPVARTVQTKISYPNSSGSFNFATCLNINPSLFIQPVASPSRRVQPLEVPAATNVRTARTDRDFDPNISRVLLCVPLFVIRKTAKLIPFTPAKSSVVTAMVYVSANLLTPRCGHNSGVVFCLSDTSCIPNDAPFCSQTNRHSSAPIQRMSTAMCLH